jgi:hypothetical protein
MVDVGAKHVYSGMRKGEKLSYSSGQAVKGLLQPIVEDASDAAPLAEY